MNWKFGIACWMVMCCVSLFAHSPAETNTVVRAALEHALYCASHDVMPDEGRAYSPENDVTTWQTFLRPEEGWSLADKMSAFYWYLDTLGTNNLLEASTHEKQLVRIAIGQSSRLGAVASVNAMRNLVRNPNGICRREAIELVLGLDAVGENLTSFVQDVMTNQVRYTRVERGIACGKYCERILAFNATNLVQLSVVSNAVNMFYRNRQVDVAAATMIDRLLSRQIIGYETSSNRLVTALFILGHPDCRDYNRRDFTAITNQLLSSGQPLQWITVGDTP